MGNIISYIIHQITQVLQHIVDTKKSINMPTEALNNINPLMTACVFIEYQNEFTTEGGALYDAVKDCMVATGTLENSRKFMDECRDAGCTIIHVPISYDKVRIR